MVNSFSSVGDLITRINKYLMILMRKPVWVSSDFLHRLHSKSIVSGVSNQRLHANVDADDAHAQILSTKVILSATLKIVFKCLRFHTKCEDFSLNLLFKQNNFDKDFWWRTGCRILYRNRFISSRSMLRGIWGKWNRKLKMFGMCKSLIFRNSAFGQQNSQLPTFFVTFNKFKVIESAWILSCHEIDRTWWNRVCWFSTEHSMM